MSARKRTGLLAAGLLVACGGASAAPKTGPGSLALKMDPPRVEMGPFYSGARLRLEGSVAAGSRVLVLVRGGEREEVFNRRRKAGPIWVVSGKVRVSGIPTTFLRFTSGYLRYFLNRDAIELHQLDEASIKHQMRLEPDQDHELIVAGWLSLKAEEGTYGLFREGVKMGTRGPQGVPWVSEFAWPRKAPPGRYQVAAYEIRDGAVVGTVSAPLPVVKVGFPAWLSALALDRSLLYGVLAVVVAAIAGFGIDFLAAFIFGRKHAASH